MTDLRSMTNLCSASKMDLLNLIREILKSRQITPDNILQFHVLKLCGTCPDATAAATLLALETTCHKKACAEWGDYYVQNMVNYILHYRAPFDCVTQNDIDWLKNAVTKDGVARSKNQYELLKTLLKQAKEAPSSLNALVLKQVAHFMDDNSGKHQHMVGVKIA